MSEKLFAEFPPVSTEQWDEAIKIDLKGADYDKKLVWKTMEGFSVRPYYRAEDLDELMSKESRPGCFPFIRGTKCDNNWLTRQDYCLCKGVEAANNLAVDGLKKGVESVGFCLDDHSSLSEEEMSALLKDIDLAKVEVNFCNCCLKHSAELAGNFISYLKKQGIAADRVRASFDFSPLHNLTSKGHFCREKAYFLLSECFKIVAGYPNIRVVNIEAYDFNNAGSSIVQELAFGLAIGSEYLYRLSELGLKSDDIASRIKFTFSISSNYFMEIAKFRAVKVLWANIVKDYGADSPSAQKIYIHAVTSSWNQTIYDAYVNMLRGTTETMSAAIAGVDSIETLPFDYAFRAPGDFSNRIARNVQTILKDESHFNKVIDPSAGSYYIETLTESIMNAAWDLFKKVEEKGGYAESFISGFVQSEILAVSQKRDKNIATRRETLLGTNQFPNFLEKAGAEITNEMVTDDSKCQHKCENIVAEPLRSYRGAQLFEQMRFATDRSEKQPKVFMLTFGNLAFCRARAQFSSNFFAVAGFKVIDNNRFATIDEGVNAAIDAKADIVVACSSDDEYAAAVPEIFSKIGNRAIVVVAGDPACRPDLEANGIKNFINVKCNVLETLQEYQRMMGIK